PELGVPDLMILDSGLWASFKEKPEYKRKKLEDQDSYNWDRLIEVYCYDVLNEHLEIGTSPSDLEIVARVMARESRFNRRLLGNSFKEFILRSDPSLPSESRVRSRMVPSPSGVVYVFLTRPHGYARELRMKELHARCYIARGINPYGYRTVVGVATEEPVRGKGFTLDSIYLDLKDLTKEHSKNIAYLKKELGLFDQPLARHTRVEEYPGQ
ncbi:MAG TPA: hypothetical protein VK747_09375, partial [Blastocatellia bacterium]|nr:hypothetical protein [Blastocatellia bacterium]